MNKQESKRHYQSALRNQQRELTRTQIMNALAEIINEGRILTFSMKEVADRAGVSYGTVYQHFPTRESLLEALYESAAGIVGQNLTLKSLNIEQLPEVTKKTVEVFEEHSTILQAFTVALAIQNIQPRSRRERDQKYIELIIERIPDIPADVAKQRAAILSHLHSSLTWNTLRQRFELNANQTANALEWALQALIENLSAQNQ
ncbi:transcriptional regulator [Desulfosporosinus orientis DSM 765]|uniref:Transcriptional regulator n=1 Tax=Desulfosporosinus orientis (strain ATCC 19365 / DSM 765 / NCIMB 8382 / VKM B-1628 / Singapore I) TaxID=768706 RepID=G7WJ90_DESOD|nr:TetR/AcrR family transcriptional regulator [Desulfosporosinus orientis]AET69749.1 transcriptional regulator [Desulfosporosinus orientis DSM 765]